MQERYLTLEGTVLSLNHVMEHTGRIIMGEMNPMPGHVEKSVENMGKQLYAEGTSPCYHWHNQYEYACDAGKLEPPLLPLAQLLVR